MDKLKPFFILFLLFILITSPGCESDKADSVMAQHEAKYPGIHKKYVYQSIIRLANLNSDPDFNKLIKDVRKITLYLPPEDSTYQIREVSNSIAAEGYEQLLEVRAANEGKISLWEKESGARSRFVGFLDTKDKDYVFEIDGELNMKYLSALQFADQGSLMDLLN